MSGIKRMAIVVTVALVGVACGAGGTGGTTGGTSCSKTWKVGLVTDVGKLSDKSFNFDSYKGVQDAQADKALCVQGRAIESSTEPQASLSVSVKGTTLGMTTGVVFGLFVGVLLPPVDRCATGVSARSTDASGHGGCVGSVVQLVALPIS